MTLPEAGGVAYADLFTKEGLRVCITARAETVEKAMGQLMVCVNSSINEHDMSIKPPNGNNKPKAQPVKQAPPPPEFNQNDEDPLWQEDIEQEAVGPIMGKDWGLVQYKPKAGELGFGDRYEVQVDEYKYGDGFIKFYGEKSQYPIVTHSMKHEFAITKFDEIFKGWQPEPDDEKHPIPKGSVILAVQCTGPDKQTTQGNPYQNLDGMRRP